MTRRRTPFRRSSLLVLASVGVALSLADVSQAGDPTTFECLTASENAIKLRGQRHLHAARKQFLVCAAVTCPVDVRIDCAQKVEDINRVAPSIVFEAKDGAGNDLASVRVSMDGNLLVDRLDGSALPVDPGEHTFTFEAAGQPSFDKTFIIREGERERHERVLVATAPPTPPPGPTTPAPIAPAPLKAAEVSSPAAPSRSWSAVQISGLAAGGLGVVAIGVGSVFGLQAISKKSDSSSGCNGDACKSGALQTRLDARSAGNTATAAFVVGGLLVVGGGAMFLAGGAGQHPTTTGVRAAPILARDQVGVFVNGSF
jgi:hypothetical protein